MGRRQHPQAAGTVVLVVTDGNLRQLEMRYIRDCHWQSVETWSTGQGVPDVNGCIDGVEFWVENKPPPRIETGAAP